MDLSPTPEDTVTEDTKTETKTLVWPQEPLKTHLVRGDVEPGKRALCGERIVGIPRPEGAANCQECLRSRGGWGS